MLFEQILRESDIRMIRALYIDIAFFLSCILSLNSPVEFNNAHNFVKIYERKGVNFSYLKACASYGKYGPVDLSKNENNLKGLKE